MELNGRELTPSSAPPRTIMGVEFRCYRLGVCRYGWFNPSGRGRVSPNRGSTYTAMLDEKMLGKRYRSLTTAMEAIATAITNSTASS